MIITGYHGTSKEIANIVLSKKEFELSSGDKEWLGNGIYFYFQYYDALDWTKQKKYHSPAILHSIIQVPNEDVLDFDSKSGQDIFKRYENMFNSLGLELNPHSVQKNHCALMNYIWKEADNYKVMIASFAKTKTVIHTLFDFRERRKEFCVRDNSVIRNIIELEVIKNE